MELYVGNLPYETTEDDLRDAFGQFGGVEKVTIIIDRETGRSKGFAFVAMDGPESGTAAMEGMDGADFGGRPLKVNEARGKENRPPRPGGGGGFGGPPRAPRLGGGGGGGRGGYGGGGGGRGGYGGGGGRSGGGGYDRGRRGGGDYEGGGRGRRGGGEYEGGGY